MAVILLRRIGMKKILCLGMALCFLGLFSSAQISSWKTGLKSGGFLELDDEFSVMGAGEKVGIVLTEASTWNENEEYLGGFIRKGTDKLPTFELYFLSFFSQRIRLHFTISGPTFGEITTNWMNLKKKEIGMAWMQMDASNLPKGIYTVTVVVESSKAQSGGCTAATYKIWVY